MNHFGKTRPHSDTTRDINGLRCKLFAGRMNGEEYKSLLDQTHYVFGSEFYARVPELEKTDVRIMQDVLRSIVCEHKAVKERELLYGEDVALEMVAAKYINKQIYGDN